MVGGLVLIAGFRSVPRDVYHLQWRLPSGRQVSADLHLTHDTWTHQQVLAIVSGTTE